LCFLGGLISIDNDVPSEEVDKRIDWLGAFLVTAGLVLIVFVLSQGELSPQGWSTPCKRSSFSLEAFLNLHISWRSRYHRTLNSRSYIDRTILLLATLSRENPRKPGISFLLVYTSPAVEALDLETRKWPHRFNDGDLFHEHVCVLGLDVLGTGSYEIGPPLMSYRDADERYST